MKKLLASNAVMICLSTMLLAQSPIIIQPANQSATPAPASAAAKPDETNLQDAIKLLQEMKAANEQLLQKQQALLEALDELGKQADQLRIYAKRS